MYIPINFLYKNIRGVNTQDFSIKFDFDNFYIFNKEDILFNYEFLKLS